jgi:threonine dehydrogenase-like Zn-dependent dehydrogenase
MSRWPWENGLTNSVGKKYKCCVREPGKERIMKALTANFSLKREAWDRVRNRIMRGNREGHGISLELVETTEPALVSPHWVRIRSILSGISVMDEAMILNHDTSSFGSFLTFPFVPGNENVGIVTEVGGEVENFELGERVVVDPLLSCEPRQVDPFCPSCSDGRPSCCRSLAKGIVGPGMLIGGCRDTAGGWGDSFIAHKSQLRPIPNDMDMDHAVLVPEFARAVKAVLQNPPGPGDRVIVMGARSLGLLTLLALTMLGFHARVLVIAEHPYEMNLVRRLADMEAVLTRGPGTAYQEVAEFVDGEVHYPKMGRITLEGGADLVYETTGNADQIEDAMRFTGEGKRLVCVALRRTSGFDISPLWFKGIRISGVGFSGKEFYDGKMMHTLDTAIDLALRHSLPTGEIITHRFGQQEHRQAFATLENRSANKAVKAIFQHVV